MRDLVVTIETAKKLRAAGFPQKTYFNWRKYIEGGEYDVGDEDSHMSSVWPILAAAPTAQEIANQLPATIQRHGYRVDFNISKFNDSGYVVAYGDVLCTMEHSGSYNLAEALGLIWLALHEKRVTPLGTVGRSKAVEVPGHISVEPNPDYAPGWVVIPDVPCPETKQ